GSSMGLDSEWVTRATRRAANGWGRVTTQENRMFRDLSPGRAGPPSIGMHTLCIPFIDSAAPRDDPRFVIWGGEISPDRDADDQSVEHDSVTDF
ncbi:hypothetical protein H0H92_008555, partial [Tricholoma furcatifolium]